MKVWYEVEQENVQGDWLPYGRNRFGLLSDAVQFLGDGHNIPNARIVKVTETREVVE